MRIPTDKVRAIPSLSKMSLIQIAQYMDVEENEHKAIGITPYHGSVFSTEVVQPSASRGLKKEQPRKPEKSMTDRVETQQVEVQRGGSKSYKNNHFPEKRRESGNRYPPRSSTGNRGRPRERTQQRGRSPSRDSSRGGWGSRDTSRSASANSNASSGAENVRCFSCNEMGHYVRDCPGGRKCRNCNEAGHEHRNCPHPSRCSACGKEGHRTAECSVVKCYNCGSRGHIRPNCPDLRGESPARTGYSPARTGYSPARSGYTDRNQPRKTSSTGQRQSDQRVVEKGFASLKAVLVELSQNKDRQSEPSGHMAVVTGHETNTDVAKALN
jgi:hypothetical protein